jgi:DNA invertase Pin-like site-specific DNA recombinase
MKYVAYYRVSTSTQTLGFSVQRRVIKDYLMPDDEIIKEYEEVASGRNDHRVVLHQAIALAKEIDATLIVSSTDRLSRVRDFVSSITSTYPETGLYFGLKLEICDMPDACNKDILDQAINAETESDMISSRTYMAIQVNRQKIERDGYYITKGGKKKTSLGNVFDEETSKRGRKMNRYNAYNNPFTVRAREFATKLFNKGMNMTDITKELIKAGIRGPRGGRYYWYTTKRLLKPYVEL